VKPFYVMEVLERSKELEGKGKDVVHFEVGEPDFPMPEKLLSIAETLLKRENFKYTESIGIYPLREKISEFYKRTYGVNISPKRVVITTGSSNGLLVLLKIVSENYKAIGYADPGYPCYRNMLEFIGANSVPIHVDESTGFKIVNTFGADALIVGSPSNPTGGLYSGAELKALSQSAFIVSDEIYHGITFNKKACTVLEVTDNAAVSNGFSKFFLMTGWRLGWLVLPEEWVRDVQLLLQNISISPPTISQLIAVHCFDDDVLEELSEKVEVYKKRRDIMISGLKEIGFRVPLKPEGAFYVYADASQFTNNSYEFCFEVLDRALVAITPGIDFGENGTERFVRFSFTVPEERIEEGLERLYNLLRG